MRAKTPSGSPVVTFQIEAALLARSQKDSTQWRIPTQAAVAPPLVLAAGADQQDVDLLGGVALQLLPGPAQPGRSFRRPAPQCRGRCPATRRRPPLADLRVGQAPSGRHPSADVGRC